MLGSSLADNVIVEPAHGGSGVGAIFVNAAQSQMNESASASFGAEGKNDERESAIANDDDPAEWKDDDEKDTASWKDGEVDQMMDSTKEISALGDDKKRKEGGHVPYRDSKLTRLLQDSYV